MKYRKKPVVVEAIKYSGKNLKYIEKKFMTLKTSLSCFNRNFIIYTLEGPFIASPGDWIVKGIAGEFYPVKDSIFRETYEKV